MPTMPTPMISRLVGQYSLCMSKKFSTRTILPPVAMVVTAIAIWWALAALHIFPESLFPSPVQVAVGFIEEVATGRLFSDLVASLWRVSTGFILARIARHPDGPSARAERQKPRGASSPAVNFFRSLSPLAWIPFAILWFGIGDPPAIFLIFMASFFPIVLATVAAVASIPRSTSGWRATTASAAGRCFAR